MKELVIDATDNNLDKVIAFIEEQLEAVNCPMKTVMQMEIAVEEIFVNIAHYAYNPTIGTAKIRTEITENPLAMTVTFIDNGVPYDPLAKEDPDITLSAEEREIGGLGIFMVKKSMDDMTYEFKDKQNILSITKNLE